jgi:DNA polymerase-4/protein ImuB
MLEQAILEAAPGDLGPRVGTATTKFTALVAARHADPGDFVRVQADEATDFLATLPASWLPLQVDAIERLLLLGIETIGEFAALPAHAVQAQFGNDGKRAWLAARGEDPTPVHPRPFAQERVREQMEASPPLVSRESILLNAEQLLGRALRHRRLAGRFVRMVRLRATSEDDQSWERTQILREPISDRARLWTVIRPLLELAKYPGPVATLELELAGLTKESGRQRSLLDAERMRRREQLDEMVRHLKVRFGRSPVARVVEVEPWSRIPERRRALMDYDP